MREEPVSATARKPAPRDTADSGPQCHAGTASCLPRSQAALQGRPRRAVPGHVVLADDDDEMRAMLTQSLRAEGYEVTECRDGMQLVGLLWDNTKGHVRLDFDLVISDIRMPGVLGLSVLAGVQAYGGGLPVILITAFGDEATRAEAYRLGAAAILDKPFEVDDLLLTVRTVLRGSP
jgi:DNA-binding response OmpR family regulator